MSGPNGARPRVLVKEKIGESGVALLREHFDVDLGVDWEDGELAERIGDYDGILIRSATKMTAELIERAARLRVIGRAGVGVDNVDVPAATRRGIVVANAPESNVVTAAEHTMALLLALARNVPQAHASLVGGAWERSKFSGVELYEKTLGILGFGRIGQLVAQRAGGAGEIERADRHADHAGAEYRGNQRLPDEARESHGVLRRFRCPGGIRRTIESAPYGSLKVCGGGAPGERYSAVKRV